MKLAPILIACALLAPAALTTAEAAATVFFSLVRQWGSFASGVDDRPFTVPASTSILCYARWIAHGGPLHATEFQTIVRDGAQTPVVIDGGATITAVTTSPTVQLFTVPVRPTGGAFATGAFTFSMVATGTTGDIRVLVYGVSSVSECGTLPPP